jgi:outer membrane protein assembly factor BamB
MTRIIVLAAGLACLVGADNWDRFRGPNGTGTVEDKDVPLTFGTKENVVWKVALPGAGNSSPVVWGQRLFLHSASLDSKLRTLSCLDTTDGKILWQRSIPGVPVTIRADSSSASSTPTVENEAVYVSFWDGRDVVVAAYDFQGEKLWSNNLGLFNSQHGAGASPILYKDKLILAKDMDKDDFNTKQVNARPSILVALNKRTGELVWETPRTAERACYSAPFLLHKPGQREPELVVVSTTAVTGYHPETGSKLWEAKGWQEYALKGPMRTVASPALAGDTLCVCSGGDAGRFAIGLALPGAGKADTPQRLWDNRKDFPYVASPVARGDYIYFVNDAGFAGCYHARTGKRIWYERLDDAGFTASPLVVSGKVYAASTAGDVYVFAAEPKFQLLARNEMGEAIRATAAVAGGRLYIRGERHLYCFGKRDKGISE